MINHASLIRFSMIYIRRNEIVLIRNMSGQFFHAHFFPQTARTSVDSILVLPLLAERYDQVIITLIRFTII
jgi:hypothetical protein